MNRVFKIKFKISASVIIFILLLLLTIFVGYKYFTTEVTDKWSAVFGSLAAGLVVAIIQFIIAWRDYELTEKIAKLKLKEILYRRNNREFYADYIKRANQNISIMGVTAIRFFNDFADNTPNAAESSKVLFVALSNGVHVRILLPDTDFIDETSKKQDIERVKQKVIEIKQKYSNLELKFFNHIPSHSIFSVDETCIVGPVFPYLESKNTPALYLENSSPIAIEYLKYFETEWHNSHE